MNGNENKEQAPATRGFCFNHTMLRVKDAQKSLNFYTEILGMTLLRTSHQEAGQFSLYFLGFVGAEALPEDEAERKRWIANRSGILELTHNWGTENDPAFHYHNGNAEPRGFGHICLSVPDLAVAVAWLDRQNVPFQKRPEEGRMRDIAFIRDPDNYWIELIQQ